MKVNWLFLNLIYSYKTFNCFKMLFHRNFYCTLFLAKIQIETLVYEYINNLINKVIVTWFDQSCLPVSNIQWTFQNKSAVYQKRVDYRTVTYTLIHAIVLLIMYGIVGVLTARYGWELSLKMIHLSVKALSLQTRSSCGPAALSLRCMWYIINALHLTKWHKMESL